MSWLLLTAAILLEVAGTTSMKLADGFSRLIPSALIFVFYGLSFVALTFAIREISLSLAYAMWAGLGTALIALIAVFWFGEAMSAMKAVSLVFVIVGVVGLHLS